jgi:hypothetical protein
MKTRWECAAVIFILAIVLASGVLTAGCLREGNVLVQDMNLQAEKITTSYATLNVTTNILNSGGVGTSGLELRLRAFSTDSGLLETEQRTAIPAIGRDETRSVSQSITLPRKGSFRIVATVFKQNTSRGQGEITVNDLDRLVADNQQSDLVMGDMDFMVKKVTGSSAVIQSDIYVSNGGATASGPVLVEVKAREMDAHLIADKQQATIANIDPEKTGIASVLLTVPDQYNYVVDSLIWVNGTIVKRCEGIVQLRPGIVISNNSQLATVKIDTSKFIAGQGMMTASPYGAPTPTKSPGFPGALALTALIAGGVFAVFRRRT